MLAILRISRSYLILPLSYRCLPQLLLSYPSLPFSLV
nr:MAG TPA: hypothetical protein [Caudoviricetes sp.]